jgi:hypothetical protein
MKKVIVTYQGYVQDMVDPGEDFEIYEGPDATIAWVDAPDNIQREWTLEWSPGQQQMIWVERDAPYTDNKVARKVAYGQIEQQLDLIYHDIRQNGVLNTDGEWYNHIATVKTIIAKPPADPDPIVFTEEYLQTQALTSEPTPDKPCRPSTVENPAWRRYPGWKGYNSQ